MLMRAARIVKRGRRRAAAGGISFVSGRNSRIF
jgi:hypothetical protein